MPELPEVETVRRTLHRVLEGHKITAVHAFEDPIVFRGLAPKEVERRLVGATVHALGRKGKYFWLDLKDSCLLIHFGMSGWAHVLSGAEQPPRYSKLIIETSEARVAFTDRRRLGRIWFADRAGEDPRIKALGFDVLDELPPAKRLFELVHRRNAPIKAVLLDQGVFSGVGNYLADEVLYRARIAPMRPASSLGEREVAALRRQLEEVVRMAVEVDADSDRFPEDWLFHHRWGGKRGAEKIGRHRIVRETVAGRTTAWVPALQK